MKYFLRINLIITMMITSSIVFSQAVVKHISQVPDSWKYEKLADVEGYLLIDGQSGQPLQTIALSAGYSVAEGWPLQYFGGSTRGGTYGNLDDDPELEIIYNITSVTHAVNPDGTEVDGWPVNTASSGEYGAPAYGDVNGDGYDDVVVSTRQPGTGNTGRIYAFNRDGTPLEGFPIYADGGPTRTPVLTDLDLDGALEIIVELRKYPDGSVCVYKGDGTIHEGWPQMMDYIPGSAVAVGDITGDEIPEIVAESYYKVWAFNTEGNVLDGFPYEPGTGRVFSYSSPVLADMDDDGLREILVGDHSSSAGNGAVHIINGDGTSVDGWPRYTTHWIYGPPAVADIDGDGNLDVAIGDQVLSGSPASKLYGWDMAGSYLEGFPIGPIWAINSQIIIADLDGDEMMELCFDDNTGEGILNGYNHDGTMMTGWPLEVEGSTFFTNPMVLDATGDFMTNLSHSTSEISASDLWLYLWESDVPFSHDLAPLPILQYNVRHTGVYGETNNPVVSLDGNEITGKQEAACYPNPCRDQTTLYFNNKNFQHTSVLIYDQDGQLVKKINAVSGSRISMNLNGLENGFFLLEIMPESGKPVYTKLVKMK